MKINKFTKNKGFTLLELFLYISISSLILFSTSYYLSIFFEAKNKNITIREVEQQGVQIMDLITTTIRNSDSINTPTNGNSSNSLSLTTFSATKNPTIFDLNQGFIRIKEGSGSYINLNNQKVNASSLNFINLSKASTPGILQIKFNLTYVNENSKYDYSFSKNFTSSASLHQP